MLVHVRAVGGAALPGATVSAVCEPTGSAAKRSDSDGRVALDLRYGNNPKRCVVTATHEDHLTGQTQVTTLCEERASCRPVDLTLEHE